MASPPRDEEELDEDIADREEEGDGGGGDYSYVAEVKNC